VLRQKCTASELGLALHAFSPHGPPGWDALWKRVEAMVTNILIVVLVLMLIGALPRWPHSANWGYLPSGSLGILVIILLVLLLTGRL
jgi:hypothetical protein